MERHRWLWLGLLVSLVLFAGAGARASGKPQLHDGPPPAIKPPYPVWPSDLETVTDRRPTFRFNGRYQATTYRVDLARVGQSEELIVLTEFEVVDPGGIAPAVEIRYTGEPLADGRYEWRVFAGNDEGFWTPTANHRVFFVSDEDRDAIDAPDEVIHPRLLIRGDEIEATRKRIERSEHLSRGWRYCVNAARDTMLLDPPDETYAAAGQGQHGNYSTCASWYHRHLENLAFVSLMTGDDQMASRGVEMIMTACGYERWLGPLFDDTRYFDPPWNSALETAMMTEAVAISYDLLYAHMTEAQRQIVREALAEKGVRRLVRDWADPIGSSRIPRHQSPGGNWVMVCTGSAGLGALALLGEHPEAPQWTRLVRNRVRAWLNDRGGDWFVDNPYAQNRPDPIPVLGPSEPNFGVDGGYKETIGYMCYGTRYVCFFADALRRDTGENLYTHITPKLLDHLTWSLMGRPTEDGVQYRFIDFGDEGGSAAWFADLHAALIKNRDDGRAAWLYERTIPVPTTPRSVLWYDDSVREAPPDISVPMGVFRGIGHVVMRRGWSPESPLAAIKFHQNRGHHDIGQFYLYGAGQPTLIDSGSTHYGSPIYAQYLCRSIAHNLVRVDDQEQQRVDGRMLAAVGTSVLTAASGQLKAAYPEQVSSWTRDLLMLPGQMALVYDVLEGKGDHQFDLVLHPQNPYELTGENGLAIGADDPKTLVDVFSELKLTLVELNGYHKTLPMKFVRYNAAEKNGKASFLMLCRWPDGPRGAAEPQVRHFGHGLYALDRREGARWLAVRTGGIGFGDEATSFESDARLAAGWSEGGSESPAHVVMLDGTGVAADGVVLMNATRRVHASLETGDVWRAHVWADEPVKLTFTVGPRQLRGFVDGEPVRTIRRDDRLQVELEAGEHHVMLTGTQQAPDRPFRHPETDLLRRPPADAPAYVEGIRTRASSAWTDGIDAIDGDPNTAWLSLFGLPMPQWLEIELPAPASMDTIAIDQREPASGFVEAWDVASGKWRRLGTFETHADRTSAELSFDRLSTDRIKVTIEKIDPANNNAMIESLRWREGRDR